MIAERGFLGFTVLLIFRLKPVRQGATRCDNLRHSAPVDERPGHAGVDKQAFAPNWLSLRSACGRPGSCDPLLPNE